MEPPAETIRFIAKNLSPGSVTLETGAGLSTALFAANGGRHICICPDKGEAERISTFCRSNGIRMDGVEFITAWSEDILPTVITEPLDLVLIDGGHGFPMPFIDWYYPAKKMKVGGLLVIDDIPL
jgi:predicted O-methyltransferase YrrM